MKQGLNIGFLPGGYEESTLNSTTVDKIFIKNRKGFVKYAIKYGYNIFCCYQFNENM